MEGAGVYAVASDEETDRSPHGIAVVVCSNS